MESNNNLIRFQDCTHDIRGVNVNPADLDQFEQPIQNDESYLGSETNNINEQSVLKE